MWIKESNRKKHIVAGALIAIVLTLVGSLVAGILKERRDKRNGGAFDWLDVLATIIGGLIGQTIQIGFYFLALKMGWVSFVVFIIVNPAFVLLWIYLFEGMYGINKLFREIKSIFIQN